MNRFRTLVLFIAGIATLCPAQQKGSIAGTVTSTTGEPLKNAALRLQAQPTLQQAGTVSAGAQSLQAYTASSDAQGKFSLEELDPGRYILYVEKPSYLAATYSSGLNPPSSVFDLASGQSLTGIALKMTPQGVITGTVTNEDGDPIPNARVSVARWGYSGGRRRLMRGAGVPSNFAGAFSFDHLTAGSYVVAVSPDPVDSSAAVRPKGAEQTYVTTYHPDVTDQSAAIAVQVNAGAVVRGIDVRVRKARSFRIQGRVVGDVLQNTILRLVPRDATEVVLAGGVNINSVQRDGTFSFAGVIPGAYILDVPPTNVRAADGTFTTTNDVGRQFVNVGNADLDNLVVQLRPGADIAGKISVEGREPTPGLNVQPNVRLADLIGQAGVPFNSTKADGTFELHHLMPSIYQGLVQPVPPGMYVKSLRFGRQDLLKSALDLTSGDGGTMEVVLSRNVADISGIVHGSDGSPAVGANLTLWTPGVPSKDAPDFIRVAGTDAKGAFKFPDLPPGDYRVAAWEQIDNGLGAVPEFRIKFETKATSVRLNENDHAQADVTLISRDNIETEAAKLR